MLKDYIVEYGLDFLALTETWIEPGENDNYSIGELCPKGYILHHIPRENSRGGGVGLLMKKCFKVKNKRLNEFASFEYMDILVN